jgi:phospholipid/cholesterol/gamma-HCH transport system substrate-binding protein
MDSTNTKWREAGLHPGLWTLLLLATTIVTCVVTVVAFNRDFQSYADITLASDRAGLVMQPNAMVKYRGVQVGRVAAIEADNPVRLRLELYPGQLRYIPANVEVQITAPTAFGAKFVELLAPEHPITQRLTAGAALKSRDVSVETNTVFQNLVGVLNQIDPAKINAVLSALAEGFGGKGEALGEAITDANQVLTALNGRSETIRQDWQALRDFSDTYGGAVQDILKVLDSASTTSSTISSNAKELDAMLLSVLGASTSGTNLIGPNKDNLVNGINGLESTTSLLSKYNPELTCLLVGAKKTTDPVSAGGFGWSDALGGTTGRSGILDVALLLGDDPYRYPDNLPINGQKGGPGGQPSCGSLPDASLNFPVRYLVTNSGWGTGLDLRPNPGIGFPGYANYFPVTRGVPEPPKISDIGPPAPGPAPAYPGGPPYGAQMYAPDGTPLWPGLPPAPPPGRPRDPGPLPAGSEPFTPVFPGQVVPTPAPKP